MWRQSCCISIPRDLQFLNARRWGGREAWFECLRGSKEQNTDDNYFGEVRQCLEVYTGLLVVGNIESVCSSNLSCLSSLRTSKWLYENICFLRSSWKELKLCRSHLVLTPFTKSFFHISLSLEGPVSMRWSWGREEKRVLRWRRSWCWELGNLVLGFC